MKTKLHVNDFFNVQEKYFVLFCMLDKQVTVTQQTCQNEIIYCEKHKPSSCDIVMGDNSNSTFISTFTGKIKRIPLHLYFKFLNKFLYL